MKRENELQPDSVLVHTVHASPNVEERRNGWLPSMVILHYTGMTSAEGAIRWLANPESGVSCHYVVDEAGFITQMVAEHARAWHAGSSRWHGECDINSMSIGIEIQNPGHERGYPDFPPLQMQAVAALCRDIAARNDIPPQRFLAHSDIAPGRKIDPGEKFDWAYLAREGVGHWVAPSPDLSMPCDGDEASLLVEALELLHVYGYGIDNPGRDDWHSVLIRSFQMHFRPARTDGKIDAGTLDTLRRLVAGLPDPAVA